MKAIQSFIECANRLLPDDAARERGGLKLEDLQYLACPTRELFLPVYKKAEKEVRRLMVSVLRGASAAPMINALT